MKKRGLFLVFFVLINVTSIVLAQDCNESAVRCSPEFNAYDWCIDTDNDGDVEWALKEYCGEGEICQGGDCKPIPDYFKITSARVIGDDENSVKFQMSVAGNIPEIPSANIGFVWALDVDKNMETSGHVYHDIGSDYHVRVAYVDGEGWYGTIDVIGGGPNRDVEIFDVSGNQIVATVSKEAIDYNEDGFWMVAHVAGAPGLYPEAQHISYPGDPYPYMHIFEPVVEGENTVIQNGVTFALCEKLDESWCKQTNPDAEGDGPFEFKWGDGKVDCSWFAADHKYTEKAEYLIKVRVKNTCGFISERSSHINLITEETSIIIETNVTGEEDITETIVVITPEEEPIIIETNITTDEEENETEEAPLCNGCKADGLCYPFGYRVEGKYCSHAGLEFTDQREDESNCDNNFECKTNLCIDNECVSSGIWRKFISWLQNLFG